MPTKKASRKDDPYWVSKLYLKNSFKEAFEKEEILQPDDAMNKLNAFMGKVLEVEGLDIPTLKRTYPKIDEVVGLRNLHHYAVDLFYETYFGIRDGAPRINDEHLQHIVNLK